MLIAALSAFAIFVPLTVYASPLKEFIYVFLLVPLGVAVLLAGAIILRSRHAPALLGAILVFCAMTWVLNKNSMTIRNAGRWRMDGKHYQKAVLAQPQIPGELKHVVWDKWGFPRAGNTTVYLVYDPGNSLAQAAANHASGKFAGLPCPVSLIRQLASQWYAVEFYTKQTWESCETGSGRKSGK